MRILPVFNLLGESSPPKKTEDPPPPNFPNYNLEYSIEKHRESVCLSVNTDEWMCLNRDTLNFPGGSPQTPYYLPPQNSFL